ncbi:MAG: HEAT repeat domain-containing protein [Phycisphaeraceae bacterium]
MMMTFLMFPLLVLGGGGISNELLDYLQTSSYWESRNMTPSVDLLIASIDQQPKAEDISDLIKQLGSNEFAQREAASEKIATKGPGVIPQLRKATKSDDPEVADRAERLIKQLSSGDVDPLVHKLMVIRTLGEMKDAKAVAALKPLLESKEAFVPMYAARAIASIEGKEWSPPAPDMAVYEKDLWMMPKGVKMVAQMTASPSGAFNWMAALKNVQNPFGGQQDPKAMIKEVQSGVMQALGYVGNVRIDGLTFGLSGDPDNNTGFMVLIVRGQYDHKKLAAVAAQQGMAVTETEGFKTLAMEQEFKVILVSDQLLVLVGGPNGNVLPMKEVIAALKTGKGTLHEDEEMAALIGGVDRKGGGWAAAVMTPTYKQVEWFKPFDTITLSRKMDKDVAHFTIKASGKNARKIGNAVEKFNADLDEARRDLTEQGAAAFIPKPFIDFMSSIKTQQNGTEVTMTASMSAKAEDLIGSMMFPFMMMRGGFGDGGAEPIIPPCR